MVLGPCCSLDPGCHGTLLLISQEASKSTWNAHQGTRTSVFPKIVRGGSLERGEEGWIVCLECRGGGGDDDDDDNDDVMQLPLSS